MPIIRTSRAVFVVGAAVGLAASWGAAWAETPVAASKPLILAQGMFGGGGSGSGNKSATNPDDEERKQREEDIRRKGRQQQNQEQPPQQKKGMPGGDSSRVQRPDDTPPPNMGRRDRNNDTPPPPPPSFGQRVRPDDTPPPNMGRRDRNNDTPPPPPPSFGQRVRPDDTPPPNMGRRDRNNDTPPPPPPSFGQRVRPDDTPPPNMGRRDRNNDTPPPPPPSFGQRVRPDDTPPPDGRVKRGEEPRVRTFGDKHEPRPDFGRRMPKDDADQPSAASLGVLRKPAPEEVTVHRRERHEFTRERLKDIAGQRREVRDEGGRIVIQEPGNRRIIRDNGHAFIQHDETDRLRRWGRDFREERGPRGERRSVFTRPDGAIIVTVVDNDGRLVRRMRRDRDGRERILIDNRRERWHRHRGRPIGGFGFFVELPPPVIRIPPHEYYVDAGMASEDEIYYALSAPPVDDIEADYTLDEIRYSPSLRDRFRRVTVSSINFEFGSWELSDDQIDRLEVVARAIRAILRRSPDEVFLISGHTDAVGSDEDNLSLSDRRAETVARVLTDEFGIPAENLVTQGYGEQYLHVETQEPERRNRRVEFQRITEALARNEE